jgi:hypothetical protein
MANHFPPATELEASRAASSSRVASSTQSIERINPMAKVNKATLGTVKCATPAAIKTADDATHEMVRVFPLPTMPEGKNDAKSFATAIQEYLALTQAIAAGEPVEIIGDDGKAIATVKPTDDIPTKAVKDEQKDKDGKVVAVTIAHGQNMAKSLPADFATLMSALADGIRGIVGQDGRTAITQEFRVGGGQRGRRAAEVNVDEFA